MARHRLFTIVAEITTAEDERQLRTLLASKYDSRVFADVETLHFACFVIFEGSRLVDEGSRERRKSLLVFECNVDGAIAPFLRELVDHPVCDDVFGHCEGYPAAGSREARLSFLAQHVRLPHLYHIGAPYRSARSIKADADLRRTLDGRLADVMAPSLGSRLAAEPSSTREYWVADLLRPWTAWITGIAGPLVAIWVGTLTWQLRLPRVIRIGFLVAYAVFALASVVAAYKTWTTSPADLRDRVRPWIRWAAAGVVWLVAIGLLRTRHPQWATTLASAFLALLAFRIWTTLSRRTNERLQAIRGTSESTLGALWQALQPVPPRNEDPTIRERLENWIGWAIGYLLVVALVSATVRPGWLFVLTVGVLFLAKGMWLAVLLGWPAGEAVKVPEDRQRIWGFVLGVPALAAVGFAILRSFSASPWLLAAVILASLFALWVVPLPSPEPAYTPVDTARLATLTVEEDQDVQNHMSALVVLRRDYRFRRPALRLFLFLLNHLFFRAWLPDLYRGKLFGIATVHFAQWVLIDERNYLFLSNYDNSWTTYLDDFGVRLESGIQKIWGQGEKNPGTKDLARFKHFARTTMVEHSLWCRAYPGLTLRQQWNNEHVRRALSRNSGEEAMAAALRRFGAAPKTLADLSHGRVN